VSRRHISGVGSSRDRWHGGHIYEASQAFHPSRAEDNFDTERRATDAVW